jgi:hypothetical protein
VSARAARGLLTALALAGAVGAGCALLAPFPDAAPDPGGEGGASTGAGESCAPGATRACYSGLEGTEGVGVCAGGVATCGDDSAWGPCAGEVVPGFESCETEADEDCDGRGCIGTHVRSEGFGDAGEQRGTAIATAGDAVAIAGYASGEIDLGGGAVGEIGSAGKPDTFLASFTQGGALRWGKRFGDTVARGAAVTSGGDILIAGGASGSVDFGGGELTGVGNGEDVIVARFDREGGYRFSRRVGNGANQFANAIAVDATGNAVIAGQFWGKLDFGGDAGLKINSEGESDGFLAMLDATGEAVWAKRFGDADYHQAGTGVAIDGWGNVLVAGWFKGTLGLGGVERPSEGESDAFVAKLSPAGDVLWRWMARSTHASKALGVAVDGAGNVFMTGSFQSQITIGQTTYTNAGDNDAFLVKLDDNGVPLWSKRFGDAADQEGVSVATDPGGNVLLTGFFFGTIDLGKGELAAVGAANGFLAKLDPAGSTIWSRSFGDSGDQRGAAVAADGLGNAWATGYFSGAADFGGGAITSRGASDAFLVELSP